MIHMRRAMSEKTHGPLIAGLLAGCVSEGQRLPACSPLPASDLGNLLPTLFPKVRCSLQRKRTT